MKHWPATHLRLGQEVHFEHPVHGRITAYLLDVMRSLENACAFAIVEQDDALGSLHSIPLHELERQNP